MKGLHWSQINPFRDVPKTVEQWHTIRKGLLKVTIFLGLVVAAVSVPYIVAHNELRRPPIEQHLTQLALPAGVTLDRLQQAELVEVVDGDGMDVLVDGALYRVRYIGVETPRPGQICYREALDRNQMLAGQALRLLPDGADENDSRELRRYVFLPDGTSIDATLVAEGFGHATMTDGRYRDQIAALQAEAQAAGRGCLWK
jgi:endonuclease YncB( thermonuclease family)